MKPLYIVGICSICAVIGAYVYMTNTNKAIINASLDQRAKEYLAQKRNDQKWSSVYTVSPTIFPVSNDASSDNKITNDCFSFTLEFPILKNKMQGRCNNYVTFESPRGEVTAYQISADGVILDQNPSVLMRRNNKTLYNEASIVVNGGNWVTFHESGAEYKKLAFLQKDDVLTVISLHAYTNDDLNQQFTNIIASIKFK